MNGSGMEGVEHKVNAWKVLNIKLTKKSQEVLGKVINLIKESEAEIPESVLDRAHRIGPTYTGNDTGKKDAKHNCQIHNI